MIRPSEKKCWKVVGRGSGPLDGSEPYEDARCRLVIGSLERMWGRDCQYAMEALDGKELIGLVVF